MRGNIRTVVPDIKEPEPADVANAGTLFGTLLPLNRLTDNDNFRLPTLTLNNYYPYGMLQAGRSRNAGGYRFGFQGQEADNKIGGLGQHLNYTFRNYDSWAIRFGAIDPLAGKYPYWSPFAFSGNRVIDAVELEGLEQYIVHNIHEGLLTKVQIVLDEDLKADPGFFILVNHFMNPDGSEKQMSAQSQWMDSFPEYFDYGKIDENSLPAISLDFKAGAIRGKLGGNLSVLNFNGALAANINQEFILGFEGTLLDSKNGFGGKKGFANSLRYFNDPETDSFIEVANGYSGFKIGATSDYSRGTYPSWSNNQTYREESIGNFKLKTDNSSGESSMTYEQEFSFGIYFGVQGGLSITLNPYSTKAPPLSMQQFFNQQKIKLGVQDNLLPNRELQMKMNVSPKSETPNTSIP